jgi:hypothetical protein
MTRRVLAATLIATCLAGSASAVDQPASIMDLMNAPATATTLVPPTDYQAASALASQDGSPLEIALSVVGPFQGRSQYIEQLNDGGETPSASRVTVVRDGLLDDSVRALRLEIALERNAAGEWTIREVRKAWLCWRGPPAQSFGTTPCP